MTASYRYVSDKAAGRYRTATTHEDGGVDGLLGEAPRNHAGIAGQETKEPEVVHLGDLLGGRSLGIFNILGDEAAARFDHVVIGGDVGLKKKKKKS